MNDNLSIYNAVRSVPDNAKKEIKGGRLNGKTDINPMWRLKVLTEQFGPCGIGWKPVIKKSWLERADNGEIAAFVEIDLYYKYDGQWSEPVPGTGGSMFVAQEKNGPYVSDECYKMAYTDAISVACKALGIGADVYWGEDKTKYDKPQDAPRPTPPTKPGNSDEKASAEQVKSVFAAGRERKKNFPNFDMLSWIDEQAENGQISTKWPYADKEKTRVNWTQRDVATLLDLLELPF